MWRWLKRPRRDDEAPPFCSAGDSQGKAGVAVTAAPPPADAPAATFDLARDPFASKSDSLRLYTDFEKLLSTGAPQVCKRRREHSLFPRFVLTVLEALRDLAQDQPLCGAYSLDTITRRVTEHFIVDGDADAQVRTALRVAHVSGLVVYYEEEQAYLLASSSFEDMQVAEWRYERYLRRRRELSSIDAARMLRKGGLKCPDTQVAKEDCACQYCGPCDPCGGPEKTSPPPPPPPPPSTGC